MLESIIMSDEGLENKRNQLRMTCIDFATRVVGKPVYLSDKGEFQKHQDDVIEVAEKIYKFVTS